MKSTTLSDAMSFIDSEILLSTEKIRNGNIYKRKKSFGVLLAAACLAFTAVSAIFISVFIGTNTPLLELKLNKEGGMGYEGEFLINPEDYEKGNPWHNCGHVCSLPVFENNSHDHKGTPCALTENQLEITVNKVVSVLEEKITKTKKLYANELYGGYEKDFVYCISAETESFLVTANAAGSVSIFLKSSEISPYELCTKNSAEYFSDKYSELISSVITLEKPEISISTEYNVYGETHHTYRIYDSNGRKKIDIINFNLNFAELRFDGNGRLTVIYIYNSSDIISEIAHYPIISESEAEKKLIAKNYISSVPYDFPGKEYIAKTDLVYKSEKGETVAPYYRFLVELPEAPVVNNMKNFGIFFVPAVKDKYISKITLIDGEFQ